MSKIFGIYDGYKVSIDNNQENAYMLGNLSVTIHGEIYNSQDLKATLEKSGYKFNTTTNPELVATAYREWAEGCPKRFNGEFSFCVYDKEKEQLFLARDHVGRNHLFYSNHSGRFIFSSDLKSIIDVPGFAKGVNLRALNYYLAFRCTPQDYSIFKNVNKLPAGCSLVFNIKKKRIQVLQYWNPDTTEPLEADEYEVLEELETIMNEAVRIRMNNGDSPGSFLSGGIDSSFVLALLCERTSKKVKTFSVGFHEKKHNEIPYSRIVANYLGTDQNEYIVEPDFDSVLEAASVYFEPLADPSIVPTYYAAKLAGEHCQTVFSGDGADSLFLGMNSYYWGKRFGEIKSYLTPPVNWALGKMAKVLSEKSNLRLLLEDITPEEFFVMNGTYFSAPLRKAVFQDWVVDELWDEFYLPETQCLSIMENFKGHAAGKMGYLEFKFNPDDVFVKIDRTSSQFNLKVMTPFLDTRLVEFAFNKIPADMKIRNGTKKYILKKLANKYLPPELPLDRKKGFNPPLSVWLKKQLFSDVRDYLLSGDEIFFKRAYVEKLISKNKSALHDVSKKIFVLLIFKIWERYYLTGN